MGGDERPYSSAMALSRPRPVHAKVLVVGMDGVRYDRLIRSPSLTPVLHGLMASGAHGTSLLPYGEADAQADGGPSAGTARTESGPGWSSVLTGVWPDRHGVTGNDFLGADYVRFPDFLTRAATARPGLRTAAAVSWPQLVRRGTLGPAIGRLTHHDGERDGYRASDILVAANARRWLTKTCTSPCGYGTWVTSTGSSRRTSGAWGWKASRPSSSGRRSSGRAVRLRVWHFLVPRQCGDPLPERQGANLPTCANCFQLLFDIRGGLVVYMHMTGTTTP